MNITGKLNLQQRFNILILVSNVLSSSFLLGLVYVLISDYSKEYSNQYWQEHTNTFANSSTYSVIIGSVNQSKSIAESFGKSVNVIRASIYSNNNALIASYGGNNNCSTTPTQYTQATHLEIENYWCFYSPIIHDGFIGYVELVISKTGFNSVMEKLSFGSILIIIIFSAILTLIVYKLSSLFTKTLMEMITVLNKVRSGERGNRVSFSGSPEIDHMRVTLNDMLANVELTEQELGRLVDERTSALKIALDSSNTANVYKAQLMSLVSHEMKTPLHAIGGYLQLLSELISPSSDSNTYSLFQRALDRVNDLNGLIDNILIHAKLETEKYQISIGHVFISPLINMCVENISPSILNNNKITLVGADVTVSSDKEVLRHIVNNLLSNACKFTQNGLIVVSWKLRQSLFIIEISDTGCGIADEHINNVFEPWWQADMSLGRKYGGHGLGLAITKQFVQRLGGSITIEPNIPSGGTVFIIRIPNQN